MPRKRSKNYEANLRKIADMCLFDNCFMNACFKNSPEFAEHILRIILDKPGLQVENVVIEDNYTNLQGHSSRLDIVARDEVGRLMNIEVQRDDDKAIPKRARYYSSLLDSFSLDKGEPYDKLRDSYVIFITEHDYFGNKLPIYHVRRTIEETNARFDDGSHIIYVNGENRDDSPLGHLMHDFACANPGELYYNQIADRIRMFKERKEGLDYMSSVLDDLRAEERAAGRKEGRAAGRKEGRAEGIAEGEAIGLTKGINNNKKDVASRMLSFEKYALNEIAAISGLSLEEVKALQAELAASANA